MIKRLPFSSSSNLLKMPETGIGYQIIDAVIEHRRRKERFLVYNTLLAVSFDERFFQQRRKIIREGYERTLNKASYISFESASLVNKSQLGISPRLMMEGKGDKGRHEGGNGATDNPKENADGKEIFVRISAYENDRRIDEKNKKLLPGSYTTTHNDYLTCLTYDDDPIDRYALPNDEDIEWAFYIQPERKDELQRGIVQPAFGHAGGGIEAFFEKGTSKNTYYNKKPYGQ